MGHGPEILGGLVFLLDGECLLSKDMVLGLLTTDCASRMSTSIERNDVAVPVHGVLRAYLGIRRTQDIDLVNVKFVALRSAR